LSTKSEQLTWRREKVIELKSRGFNHSEISRELQIPRTSVVEDINWLRNRAKERIKEYTTSFLPEQYQICLAALDTIIKHAYEILQNTHDNREKLQAMELFSSTHITKLELLSNATTIDTALNFIRQQQQDQHNIKSEEEEQQQDNVP
jgi:hypothetical protein